MLPRKGFRKIEVKRHTWLWRVRETFAEGMELTVSPNREGKTLMHWNTVFVPGDETTTSRPNWVLIPPKAVARLIEIALAYGWDPEGTGIFRLELIGDDLVEIRTLLGLS